MTPAEFSAVWEAWIKGKESDGIEAWRRVRALGCMIVQPWVRETLDPAEVMPLKGDDDRPRQISSQTSRKRDGHEAFMRRMKQIRESS